MLPESGEQTAPSEKQPPEVEHSRLSLRVKLFYSVGHIFNDLNCAVWFAYTLLFFKFRFSHSTCGLIILLGQIADAVASPLVGFLSDRSSSCRIVLWIGRRKFWHLLGLIGSAIAIPLFYNHCLFGDEATSENFQFVYYATLAVLWQASWAAMQVGHISMINDLTPNTNERIALNTYRQAATVSSNICLYAVSFFVLSSSSSLSLNGNSNSTQSTTEMSVQRTDDEDTLSEGDLIVFTYIAYIVTAVGVVFSLMFQFGVPESDQTRVRVVRPSLAEVETKEIASRTRGSQGTIAFLSSRTDIVSDRRKKSLSKEDRKASIELAKQLKHLDAERRTWHDWLRSVSFWKITLMYTFGRLLFNVSQVYTPLYLQNYLRLPKRTIAINPFATYFSGLVFSFAARPISRKFGSRTTTLLGAVFGLVTALWLYLGTDDAFRKWQIYLCACLLGVCTNYLIIGATALISDLIGPNAQTAGFVFASMSFVSKIVNGVVVAILEQTSSEESTDGVFYRWVLILLTAAPSGLTILLLLSLWQSTYGRAS